MSWQEEATVRQILRIAKLCVFNGIAEPVEETRPKLTRGEARQLIYDLRALARIREGG